MKKEVVIAVGLVTCGVFTRTVLHIGPNIEFITGIAFASSWHFRSKYLALATVLASLIISDLLIGNTIIFLFTWSGFLFPIFFSWLLKRLQIEVKTFLQKLAAGFSAGIFSNLFFFLWTNFGVVVLTKMYDHNLGGVIDSYINALPFLKVQLLSNIFITPFMFVFVSALCSKHLLRLNLIGKLE